MDVGNVDPQKGHKKRQAGSKFNKKKKRKFEEEGDKTTSSDPAKRNPKAFSFQVYNHYILINGVTP